MASSELRSPTSLRKQEHLDLCREQNVESLGSAGWDSVKLPHVALPEIDFEDVSTEAPFLNADFSMPLLISSMTGGNSEGDSVNHKLARFAQEARIPMGVGSQRAALEERSLGKSESLAELRRSAPRAFLMANIGLVQLNHGVTPADLAWLVEQLQAQALILHANVLQEAIQKEGDRDFSGLLPKIAEIRREIQVPIILKETGCGLDVESARRAVEAGVDALDVAGLGGTHWGFIEGLRSTDRRELGEIFRDWGIPTAQALRDLRAQLGPTVPMIASGGLRNGLDIARALHLGANFCGMALPFLKAASASNDPEDTTSLHDFLNLQKEALRVAHFCMGKSSLTPMDRGFYGNT